MTQVGHLTSFQMVKELEEVSDLISQRAKRFGKPEVPGKRGRKPGSKNRPGPTEEELGMRELIEKVETQKRMFELGGAAAGQKRGRDESATQTVSELRQKVRLAELEIEKNQDEVRRLAASMKRVQDMIDSDRSAVLRNEQEISSMYDAFYSDMARRFGMTQEQEEALRAHFEDTEGAE